MANEVIESKTNITIAVPTYNRGARLGGLLKSIQQQATAQDELLVLDDASTDQTPDLATDFPRFRFERHTQNLGMVGNWNACLKAATREWVCLIHDDDELLPGGMDLLRKVCAMGEGPALVAHRPLDLALDNAFRFRACQPGPWSAWNCPTLPSGVVIHRQIIDDVGLFDHRFPYSADIEYFGRICARFPHYVIESPEIVHYRLHDGNYQLATWRQPDFFDNYMELQQTLLKYANARGEVAEAILDLRLKTDFSYILSRAREIVDRQLIRKVCRRMIRLPGWGPRKRLKLTAGAWMGIFPFEL